MFENNKFWKKTPLSNIVTLCIPRAHEHLHISADTADLPLARPPALKTSVCLPSIHCSSRSFPRVRRRPHTRDTCYYSFLCHEVSPALSLLTDRGVASFQPSSPSRFGTSSTTGSDAAEYIGVHQEECALHCRRISIACRDLLFFSRARVR